MTFSVSKKQIPAGNPNYYSKGFRNMIENYLPALKKINSTRIVQLKDSDRVNWIGDFYGLLLTMDISQDLFWITARLNGLHSPADFDGTLREIYIPSSSTLDAELQKYITTTF